MTEDSESKRRNEAVDKMYIETPEGPLYWYYQAHSISFQEGSWRLLHGDQSTSRPIPEREMNTEIKVYGIGEQRVLNADEAHELINKHEQYHKLKWAGMTPGKYVCRRFINWLKSIIWK